MSIYYILFTTTNNIIYLFYFTGLSPLTKKKIYIQSYKKKQQINNNK